MSLNDSNSTTKIFEWLPGLQITACVLYTIILLIGIIGNTLVIIVVIKYRDMRNSTNLLFANLSVADLSVLLFCVPEGYQHLYSKDEYHFGSFMCSFSPFLQNATSLCSVLTIMAISYERYIAICQPLRTLSINPTIVRTVPTVILIWFISCFISVPFFMYSRTFLETSTYNRTIITCWTHFPKEWSIQYLVLCTLCPFLFTSIILCYWHVSMCRILYSRDALLRDNTNSIQYGRQVAQLLTTLIITLFTFILPYKIWAFIQHRLSFPQLYEIGFHSHGFIMISTRLLLYLNSAINPILYSIMSTRFRESFVALCHDCCQSTKQKRSSITICYRGSNVKQVLNGNRLVVNNTILIKGKTSSSLEDNTITPIATAQTTMTKFVFPECSNKI